jgi:hypothetical protein
VALTNSLIGEWVQDDRKIDVSRTLRVMQMCALILANYYSDFLNYTQTDEILFVTNITAGCLCFAVAGFFFVAFRNVELIGEFSKLYLNVDMISNMALFQDQAKDNAGTMNVIAVSEAGSQHERSYPTLKRPE